MAAVPPHIATTDDTAVCAMCHRSKTGQSGANTEWSRMVATATADPEALKSALLVGSAGDDDTGLCYSCHGVERMGSGVDVQSAFETSSTHITAPMASTYGRSPKQCSTCHDSHGEDRVAGEPRPALLRSIVSTSQILYSGAEFCASCHDDDLAPSAERWDGLEVWQGTAHASKLPVPASGTGIICSVCHEPHGSDVAPSIQTAIMPPAVLPPEGVAVTANDRSFCLLCHPYSPPPWPSSWVSSETYAPSAHASSAATITIAAEYAARDLASNETSRLVGECQNCHSPMGRSDGTTDGVIPKLLDKKGRQLCDDCHDADGPAESNVASLAFPASRVDTEVIAVWRPSVETSIYGDAAVYTRGISTAELTGPRVFKPSLRTGDASAGDIDGLPGLELAVGDPSRARVDVYESDPVQGLKRRTLVVPDSVKPYLLTLADVVKLGTGPQGAQDSRAEIVIVERDPLPPHVSRLHVFSFNGSVLTALGPARVLGPDASGLAAGHVTGTARDDVVVTANTTEGVDDEFRIFTEGSGELAQSGGPRVLADGTAPRGVSIGNVWDGETGNEIVVCFAGRDSDNLGVFSGASPYSQLATYTTDGDSAVTNRPYDSAIADVLWDVPASGGPRQEVVVALRSDPTSDSIASASSVNVFAQLAAGSGLSSPVRHRTGRNFESSAVEVGDVDGDGKVEVVVGNSGKWLRGTVPGLELLKQAPSLTIFDSGDGTSLESSRTLWSTGVEQASGIQETTTTALGTAPSIVVADIGAVGPSRHPGDAGSVTHVSTETATVGRHVTCADCHNAHETTATVPTAPTAMYGALKGAWGAAISNTAPGAYTPTQAAPATREYQICLKCHSNFSELSPNLGGTRDIASEVNTRNASTHAVQGPSLTASTTSPSTFVTPTAGQFVNSAVSWSRDSQLFCIDCHTNSDAAQARGPHISGEGSLLRAPVWGVTAASNDLLCYLCHQKDVYYGGTDGSRFTHPNKLDMHKVHTKDTGFSCRTCHVSHGAPTLPHLQNSDHDYEHTAQGGACTTECHTGGARHAYSRVAAADLTRASAVSVLNVTVFDYAPAASITAALASRDATDLVVEEENGFGSDYSVEMTFTPAAMPTGVEFYGRYQGAPGHIVQVQAWDFPASSWDTTTPLGVWPSTLARGTFSFAINKAKYYSATNTVRIRVIHTSPGNPNHNHYFDSVWLNP